MLNRPFFRLRWVSLLTSLAIVLVSGAPLTGFAAHIEGGKTVKVTAPIAEDSYLAGEEVYVDARIDGDLIAAGGKLFIRDSIFEDLQIAGGEIEISGYVGDDVRVAGGEVTLRGEVAGDVIVAGGELRIEPGAKIRGDLVISGGDVEIGGIIWGQLKASGGNIDFSGTAKQNASFDAGQLQLNGEISGTSRLKAENIELGENAKFHGNVEYWQKQGEMDFGPSLMNTTATFNPELKEEGEDLNWKYLGMGFAAFWVGRLIGVMLLMGVLVWLFTKTFDRAGSTLVNQPLRSFGLGLLYLVVIPILALLLVAIVVGIPLGLFTLINYFFTLFFGQAVAMLVLANAVNIRYEQGWSTGIILLMALVGYVALKLINWIPVAGMLVSLVLVSAAFGALIEPLFHRPEPDEFIEPEPESFS